MPAGPARKRRGNRALAMARAIWTALVSSLLTAALFAVSAVVAAIGASSILAAAVPAPGSATFTMVTPVPPAPVPPPPRVAPGPASHGPRPATTATSSPRSAPSSGLLPFGWRVHNCPEGGRVYRLEDGCSGAGQGSP